MEIHSNPTVYAEMKKLNDDILYHNDLYHNKDTHVIPHSEFDAMVERFDELAEIYPDIAKLFVHQQKAVPLHDLTNEGLEIVVFDSPMLSLKKALTWPQFDAWLNKFPSAVYLAIVYEKKIDGLALEIRYLDWKLHKIFTRGDGLKGEDVTHSFRLFGNIPAEIPKVVGGGLLVPGDLVVRGEGCITIHDFLRYNETAVKPAANPRNAVSGWVRALEKNQNKDVVGILQFYAYWTNTSMGAEDYNDLRSCWEAIGFHPALLSCLEDIRNDYQDTILPTDGIVGKVRSFTVQEALGYTNKHPNWAIAYKFPDEEKESPLERVIWQTSMTGRVVPVVEYTPIELGGVTCRRANLDNYHQFMALELHEDSVLGITRNGNVIPRVSRVVDRGFGSRLKAPVECPSCNSKLELKTGKTSTDLVCKNVIGCSSQLLNRCVSLVNKRCLDIDGLGPVQLGELITHKKISSTADLFMMTPQHVGDKLYAEIQGSRIQFLHRAIKALGLPGIDLIRAKKIAKAMSHIKVDGDVDIRGDMLHFIGNVDNLVKIPGISTGIALPIAKTLEDNAFWKNALNVLMYLDILPEGDTDNDLKVCITGELGLSRDELIDYFADQGIELVDNLTKSCVALIVGEKPGNVKLLKATELGIFMVNSDKASSIDNLIEQIKNHNQGDVHDNR